MRVNVYAEEMTDRVELVEKVIDGEVFTGVRFWLALPVTLNNPGGGVSQMRGPFMHKPNDDDSAAITFWGKKQLRESLQIALKLLDERHQDAHRGDPADGRSQPTS